MHPMLRNKQTDMPNDFQFYSLQKNKLILSDYMLRTRIFLKKMSNQKQTRNKKIKLMEQN